MAVGKHLVKVLSKKQVIENYWHVVFERPAGFDYHAGQYVSIKVSEDGQRRSYSLASSPESMNSLEIMVDVSPMGLGSQLVLNLNVGDTFEILGPMGRFTVEESLISDTDNELVFIATGSGIVPMRSMIQHLLYRGDKRKIKLHWGMRYENPFWKEEFEQLQKSNDNFVFDLVISKPGEAWTGCKGHVTDCLSLYTDFAAKAYLLCGSQKMIDSVSSFLMERGVKKESIFFEKFY